jgi:hypothetical protein
MRHKLTNARNKRIRSRIEQKGEILNVRLRIVILLLGWLLPQVLLYGPSLTGSRVLLPLDFLAAGGVYLPTPANAAPTFPENFVLSDEVLLAIPTMQYAAKEMRAGHIPLWNPQNFAGSPFAAFPKYSPFFLIFCCWPSPTSLAYLQVMKSVIAGAGAYLFFRRALGAGFWASAFGAWAYPLTGFFVQWQGYGLTHVVAWLPWILLSVNLTIRRVKKYGPVLLALFTGLALLTGQLDVAGLVLLSSGIYAIACLIETYGWRKWNRRTVRSLATLALGWGLGVCISMAYVAPLLEYSRTGERFARRSAGEEERPPVGVAALPQVVLPNLYGSTQKGSIRIADGNQLESSASGFAGLLATLLLAPLAFCDRDRRAQSFWWLGFLVLSLAWVLAIPGLVQLMRLPRANMFSWNRWVFLAGFALTVLAVCGLDAMIRGMVKRQHWFAIPALLGSAVCAWCAYRMGHLPQQVQDFVQQAQLAPANAMLSGIPVHQAADMVQGYFRFYYAIGAGLGAITVLAWVVLYSGGRIRSSMIAAAAGLAIAELLVYAYNVNPQCDPALYYPRLTAFEELKQRPPARILCVSCLPAELNLMVGLPDIRGYDAVDPKRLLDVLEFARDPGSSPAPYARTQWFVPLGAWSDNGSAQVSPILNMLNVRYLIWASDLPSPVKPIIQRDGYAVVENEHVLPRAFVPQTVQVADEPELMDRLREQTFDAAKVSYVSEPVTLPAECRGNAVLKDESPERVVLDVQMETAGIVVLADLWDQGWHATVDGQLARILVVNHAIRGVTVSAGKHRVEFQYMPDSVRVGRVISGAGLLATVGWLAFALLWKRNEADVVATFAGLMPTTEAPQSDRNRPGAPKLKSTSPTSQSSQSRRAQSRRPNQ